LVVDAIGILLSGDFDERTAPLEASIRIAEAALIPGSGARDKKTVSDTVIEVLSPCSEDFCLSE
jgi:hypothetical protein